MSTTYFEDQLSHFEAQLVLLSAALARNDANELVATSAELQSMAVLCSKVMQQEAVDSKQDPAVGLRVKKIVLTLASMRQALMRRSVVVDQALAALVPATRNDTYAPKSGAYAQKTYGSAGRQSGEFRVMAA